MMRHVAGTPEKDEGGISVIRLQKDNWIIPAAVQDSATKLDMNLTFFNVRK